LLTFSKKDEPAFTTTGFNNWKKAAEKFTAPESCSTHKEALLKWRSIRKPSISQQISSRNAEIQAVRREGLLKQLSAMRFLHSREDLLSIKASIDVFKVYRMTEQ